MEKKMKIALHDADKTDFPNLALMKLSAWHKSKGDDVGFFNPMVWMGDICYSSKIMTFTENDGYIPLSSIRGGIGYKKYECLDDNIEHIMPDYGLYKINYSMGFLTRGCPNNCSWCFVPEKEGGIRPNADITEFTKHKNVILMDNNVLAHNHGIKQIEKMSTLNIAVDFNQGLDARLIDDSIARRLSKLKWLNPVRLACDRISQMDSVYKAVTLLRWHNVTPRKYFCYVLVKDIGDALERIKFLKSLYVDPFAQPYRDKVGTPPTEEQKNFARWVNHKAIFNSVPWEEYNSKKKNR